MRSVGTTFAIIVGVLMTCTVGHGANVPKLILYHSFDQNLLRPDEAVGPVKITAGKGVVLSKTGVYGRSCEFPAGASDATLTLSLGELVPSAGWTLTLFDRLIEKEVLAAPDTDFLKVLDQDGRTLLTVNQSGLVRVLDTTGRSVAQMDCFDALYWIGGEDIHLALTYDADGASAGVPKGKLTLYWEARPYGCLYTDLGARRPSTIVLGGNDAASAADELYIFDAALPLRAIYNLSRPLRKNPTGLATSVAEIGTTEAARPATVRMESWRALVRDGQVIEAEGSKSGPGVIMNETTYSASAGSYVEGSEQPLKIPLQVSTAGEYAISLRYALDRNVDQQWPVRHPEAKTAWTYNFTTVKVSLDGKDLGTSQLYPTGIYNGHTGDVEPWTWLTLAGKIQMGAGPHAVEIRFVDGLAKPMYDAILLSTKSGPAPSYPRWVDGYRIPPAWWVGDHKTSTAGGKRIDTYTVTLRNRCDEPYAAAIELETDMLGEQQRATTKTNHVQLAPHEEKAFEIIFETPADKGGSSGYLRVVLWNDDVESSQEYRLWNYTPVAGFAKQQHPSLIPLPDPAMQAKFRSWIEKRDPAALTDELKKWAGGPDLSAASPEYKALETGAKVRLKMFRKPLLGDQLTMLDMWMNMSAAQADMYLSDASAEDHGYGTTWDKVANKLTGAWHGSNWVTSLEPAMEVWRPGGDLDLVTKLTAKGVNYETLRKDKKEVVSESTWTREQDPDVFMSLRCIRWATMISEGNMGISTEHPRDAGLPILAEAYYLTGDERYAHKAVELAQVYARKYTLKTRQFYSGLHREDRDWWGTRLLNRYSAEMGPGVHQILGVHLLDLCWNGLSEKERDMLQHNLVRWGMYEGTNGSLWDDPDKGTKVNREDLPPYIAFARIVGDAGPSRGLEDYERLLNKMVLSDGIHNCSIGTYGGVSTYIGFMQRLAALGVDVSRDNPSLRNAFLNHSRFVFSCGALEPMDDGGGGQNLLQLGPSFGAPSKQQLQWGFKLYGDPLMPVLADFLQAVYDNCNQPKVEERANKMRAFYANNPYPVKGIWPAVFVAKDKGMAMLRNRAATDPCDWIEVLFDYGKYGGRFHGHPTKLSILTAFNGQVGSQDYGDLTRNAPENNNSWFTGGYCHNTVQVDFKSHRTAGAPVQIGELIESGDDGQVQWIDAKSDKMFDGVHMRRTTFITDAGVVDLYLCKSDAEHVYDWPYHNYGLAGTDTKLTTADVSKQGLLQFAQSSRSGKADGLIQVTWKDQPLSSPPHKGKTSLINEDVFVRLWALPQAGTELVMFAGPTVTAINEEKQIDYAMLRRKAASTVFAVVLEPWRASAGPKIKSVEQIPVTAGGKAVAETEAYAVKLTRTDGKVQLFLVNYSGGKKTVAKIVTGANVACWTMGVDGNPVESRHSEKP